MSSALRTILLLPLFLGLFSGCLTRSKTPVATGPSPEYQAALAKIVRVPQPHPLLDEGTVPQRALEIVTAYQDIARRGKYRELARFYEASAESTAKDALETSLLRREVETGPTTEVLRDVVKYRDNNGVRYEFQFQSVQRTTTKIRYFNLREKADGTLVIASDGA